VCAVSYLNTVPLVWGMLHGEQRDVFDLEFALPSECADRLRDGRADIGLPPVAALLDQDLAIFRGAGIASRGAVRTILLISRKPFDRVETLATDAGSRTSVLLARIILANRYGTRPALVSMPPDLETMLGIADAALIIGDPALRIDPAGLPCRVYDLGAEWVGMTGLPMVFAVWAVRREFALANPGLVKDVHTGFIASRDEALAHVDEVAEQACRWEVFDATTLAHYFRTLDFSLGPRQLEGLLEFGRRAAAVGAVAELVTPRFAEI